MSRHGSNALLTRWAADPESYFAGYLPPEPSSCLAKVTPLHAGMEPVISVSGPGGSRRCELAALSAGDVINPSSLTTTST